MDKASRLENVVKLREVVNKRNAELKEIGAQIKALLEDTHKVIITFCSELGSNFGMDEVDAPTRLEEIMPTAIPTDPTELKSVLHAIRLNIFNDTGIELNILRKPLRNLEIIFDKLNLDQYLSVEGEESLDDGLEDSAFSSSLLAVVARISGQAAAIAEQRSFFRGALEDMNSSSQERRSRMNQEVPQVFGDLQSDHQTEDMVGWLQSIFVIALPGRDVHDQHLRTAVIQRVRGFLFPIVAKPAFDIFERLDGCTNYARLKR